MQLRMLARRSISGSMTVVGDMGQATAAGAAGGWDLVVEHLAPRRTPSSVELTVSYRTPKEVLEVAANVLAVAEPALRPPLPVRSTGVVPDLRVVPAAALDAEVLAAVRRELAEIADGRVAVVVADEDHRRVSSVLERAGLRAVDPRDRDSEGLAAHLVVLPADSVNGLEFDSVVVIEPHRVAAHGATDGAPTPRGLRVLYVALTRPTRRLTVLGSVDVPYLRDVSSPSQRWHAEAAIH